MRYLFCFKIRLDETQGSGSSRELVIDRLLRAVEAVETASRMTEVVADGWLFVDVATDEKDAAKFKSAAPMQYCFELLPEFEPDEALPKAI